VATPGCAVAGGAQVVASTASKVEEEDYISTLSGFAALPGGHILVLVHYWCFIYWFTIGAHSLHPPIHRRPLRGGSMLSPTQPRKRVGGRHD